MADGEDVVIDCRPHERIRPRDAEAFEATGDACQVAGWEYRTTIEFRPTLQKQCDDAQTKGQVGRQKVFDGLLERLEGDVS
jgi:integrase/recombinase XerD